MPQPAEVLARINNYDLAAFITGVLDSDPDVIVTFNEASLSQFDSAEIYKAVGLCSNAYSKASIAAAVARTRKKSAEQRLKLAFRQAKSNSDGRNADEREAYAAAATTELAEELELAESYYNIAVAAEEACRVASETARKLLGSATNYRKDDGANESRLGSTRW